MLKFFPPKIKAFCKRKPSPALLSSSATSSFPAESSPSYLSNLTAAILNSSTPEQAMRIFNSASRSISPAKTLKLHSAIVHFLVGKRVYEKARCLLKGLIEVLRETRKPHRVCSSIFNALNQVEFSECDDHVFGVLISALCDRGLVDEGHWVYRKMGKLPPVQPCNTLLNGIRKTGQVDLMWEVYDGMVSNGLWPSEVTYGILIDACCDGGDTKKARLLLEEMIGKGLKPTVVIYTSLIRGLCSEGKMSEAESIFLQMEEFGVAPNRFTYNVLLDAYAKTANAKRVMKLYYQMLEGGVLPNVVTYVALIYLLSKIGELVAFRSYFVHMLKFNVTPDIYIYNCLMDGFCEAGDLSSAVAMHVEMDKFGISPDVVTYGILMKGYSRTGRVEDAEVLLSKMHESGFVMNSVVYNTIIDGYCKKKSMGKAVEMCSQMVEKGLQPNIVTFRTLINGYCKTGKLEAAMGVYHEMMIKGYKPDVVVYTSLIDGYFKNGYTNAALQLHKEMIAAGVSPNSITLSCVIDGLCKAGRINNAISFFLKHTIDGSVKGEEDRGENYDAEQCCPTRATYSILINSLCKNGRVLKASKFFSDMRKSGLQPEVGDYAAVVEGHFGDKRAFPVMMLQADMLKMGILPNEFMYKVLERGYEEIAYSASAQKCRDDIFLGATSRLLLQPNGERKTYHGMNLLDLASQQKNIHFLRPESKDMNRVAAKHAEAKAVLVCKP